MDGITKGIPGVEVAYLVSYPDVSLFFKVTRKNPEEAAAIAEQLASEARRRLGDKAYGEGDATLEAAVGELLQSRGLTIATAESCTGGLIAERITEIAGSSAYFGEGVVTYSNKAKEKYLGVSKETLREHGAVSAEVCGEMLEGILKKSGAGVGIAVTGIAGPGGGTAEKPVGLVYIGWGDADGQEVREFRFHGERQDIRQVTASTALDLIRRFLLRKSL
jgi:nicotinamide-nucleotide amidase